ncbi:hypothetical protein H5P28_12070 [Ruficoccus amylovorans]|uniref:Uncharacterized protein n=1 Tax=Ruficoccus amylovorans TaxID=1804625 RepID=A0A842HHF0_9BACT|nr:hypothetical protein [Ruficoccus amylovorans]MBC2594994.1 hypothetical protein [Ruficoccus amylovorans]
MIIDVLDELDAVGVRARTICEEHRAALRGGENLDPDRTTGEVREIVVILDDVLQTLRRRRIEEKSFSRLDQDRLIFVQQRYLALLHILGETERMFRVSHSVGAAQSAGRVGPTRTASWSG